ncbi:MAG TPA: DUF2442 domain-containing protein [Terracidiphilus sp.]|jgi:hypothetical protein|nr:DUF2442 domain-containing protein [Terracidiphilus sp.]
MPESARIAVTDADIDEALGRARKHEKYFRRVLRASYTKVADDIRLVLEDGAKYSVPRRLLQGLSNARESELRRIQIVSEGMGLLWPLLDIAHYIPGLLQGVYGSEKWMAALYRQRAKPRLVARARNQKSG